MDLDQVKLLIAKGQDHFNKGNWDAASKELSKARSLLEKMKLDTEGKEALSEILQLKAYSEARRGQYRIAIQAAEKAQEVSRSIGDLEGEAEALRRHGYIYWIKGDLSKASEFFDEALVKARECNANALVGKIRIEQGNVSASLWQYDDATEHYTEAIRILKTEQQHSDQARAYNNLGFILLVQKKYREAVKTLKMAMDLADKAGDIRLKNLSAINAAESFVLLGSPDVADELLGPVTKIMLEFDDKAGIASAYRIYGMIHTIRKEWPKAETYFRKAHALVKVAGNPEMEGAISKEYGRMFIAKGDKERARLKLSEAFEVYKRLGVKDKAADVALILRQTQD